MILTAQILAAVLAGIGIWNCATVTTRGGLELAFTLQAGLGIAGIAGIPMLQKAGLL